jgi:hypothetical protein
MSDVVDLLATGTYAVTRNTGASFVNGVRTAGSTSTFTITACVQPLRGLEIDRLPDGFRNSEAMVCFTGTELKVLNGTTDADTVQAVEGLAHQVQSCERWGPLGNFYRAILVRPAS